MQNAECETVFWDKTAVTADPDNGVATCTMLKGMLDILRGLIACILVEINKLLTFESFD